MKRRDGKGCVYFITDGSGCVKIGKSKDRAECRLYELQTGNPRPLRVMKSITTGRNDLDKFEKSFHALFAQWRITNNIESEWFTNADEIYALVKNLTSVTVNTMLRKFGKPSNDETRSMWLEYMVAKSKDRHYGNI